MIINTQADTLRRSHLLITLYFNRTFFLCTTHFETTIWIPDRVQVYPSVSAMSVHSSAVRLSLLVALSTANPLLTQFPQISTEVDSGLRSSLNITVKSFTSNTTNTQMLQNKLHENTADWLGFSSVSHTCVAQDNTKTRNWAQQPLDFSDQISTQFGWNATWLSDGIKTNCKDEHTAHTIDLVLLHPAQHPDEDNRGFQFPVVRTGQDPKECQSAKEIAIEIDWDMYLTKQNGGCVSVTFTCGDAPPTPTSPTTTPTTTSTTTTTTTTTTTQK